MRVLLSTAAAVRRAGDAAICMLSIVAAHAEQTLHLCGAPGLRSIVVAGMLNALLPACNSIAVGAGSRLWLLHQHQQHMEALDKA